MVKSAKIYMLAFLAIAVHFDKTIGIKLNNDNLIAVVQLFRHGQRTPAFFYANDPYSDTSYWGGLDAGQLTNEGKRQHYALGQFTRNRYEGFLPKNYSNDDFYAQTTDVDRTHMSAQCDIAGIYPPSNDEKFLADLPWQPVPVHPMSTSVSNLADCPTTTTQLAQVLATEKEFLDVDREYADVYEYLTNKTGNTVDNLIAAWYIRDTLYIEDQTGHKLPEWTNTVFPEPLKLLTEYAFRAWAFSDEQKRLGAGVFLNTVVEYFKEMFADPSSNPQYQMYSAHDTNVGPILRTLGYQQLYIPGFASTIYFELRNKSGKAVVNVLHRDNGILEQVSVTGCKFDCPLGDFQASLSPYLMDSATYIAECASDDGNVTTSGEQIHRIRQLIEHIELVKTHRRSKWNNNRKN